MVVERPSLGQYLRAKREATQPRDVGLRDSGRRRTPGLRREEVATLAGVSVDYLVRLEQGRDTHPSGEVIMALADALRMTDEERRHLSKLAVVGANGALCPAETPLVDEVSPNVVAILERLDPTPAFVIGPATDLLAWNDGFARLVGPLGFLDRRDQGDGDVDARPNLARYVFTDARARTVYPAWRSAADEQASALRHAAVRWGSDPRLGAVVDSLAGEPEFATRWAAHPIAERRRGDKLLLHPELGELAIAFEVLALPDDGEQLLVTWFPADEATAAALATLDAAAATPPRLRVVGRA